MIAPAMLRGYASTVLRITAVAFLAGCSTETAPVAELTGPTMGTVYRVQLSPPPDERSLSILQLRIDERLRDINSVFSTYLDHSAISRFNRNLTADWQRVPPELVELVRHADVVSRETDGRYDITIAPLVNAWGFGSAGDRENPPDRETIESLLTRIGYQKLSWQTEPAMLKKQIAGLEIDLSSIAKGWAVDEIGTLLEAQGFDRFLVDIGGETLARGHKASGQPWRVAIERPASDRTAQGVMTALDVAVATSGDYRNFFEHEGRRYSHTIDPSTGQSVRHRLASVTVLADTGTEADAWATALMALGDAAGILLAEQNDIAALFIVREDDGFTEHATAAFSSRVEWDSLQ